MSSFTGDHPEAAWFQLIHTALQYQYVVCWHVAGNADFQANAALRKVQVEQQIPDTEFWTISIVGLLDENRVCSGVRVIYMCAYNI